MLSERHALVTDFGVAKAVNAATERESLTTVAESHCKGRTLVGGNASGEGLNDPIDSSPDTD
jgi:hypothetical protein